MQKQRKTSNTTTSEIVLESLREQIINGILQPQEKLVEAITVLTKDVQSHCFLHKTLMKSFFCAAALKNWQSKKVTAFLVTIVS